MMTRQFAVACLLWSATAFCSDGEYLFSIAGCLACHTTEDGDPLAGGRAFETPYGTFYSPNITPDPKPVSVHGPRQNLLLQYATVRHRMVAPTSPSFRIPRTG